MPSENEELDVFKNRKWRLFVNTVRGAPGIHDEVVLRSSTAVSSPASGERAGSSRSRN